VDQVADQVMIKYKWTGRPNVAPSRLVKQQSAAFGLDVVGEWDASHFNWKDSLTISRDGRFCRGNGEQGSWSVIQRAGRTVLCLEWDRFPTEELQLEEAAEAQSGAGGGALAEGAESPGRPRHVFRGHGTLVSTGLSGPIPFPDLVPATTSTFTLRPKGCPPSPLKSPVRPPFLGTPSGRADSKGAGTPARFRGTPSSSYLNLDD